VLRPAVVTASALAATMAVTGCNATKRELTVVFVNGASAAQQESALRVCTGAAPHTSPEPLPTPGGRFKSPGIRFRIDSADDRDIARLEACLEKQPGVRGFQDSADSS
jgi:hypothetical protein